MPAIIIATDFSPVANNAAFYACNMAVDSGASVIVLHSYILPVTFNENPMPVLSMEECKNAAEAQMDVLLQSLRQQNPALDITGNVVYGDVTDNLKSSIAEHNAWLVIVGNSSSDDHGFWLGSNLLSTLRHLKCPVIAVPDGYEYTKVRKIAFACDFKHVEESLPSGDLVNLVAKMGSELHVLNVDYENRSFDPGSPLEYAELNDLIAAAHPQYHNIDNKDTEQGIRTFVEANDISWLIVVPHKHSFFEGLFHKSQTKAILSHAHIPIVALHEKN